MPPGIRDVFIVPFGNNRLALTVILSAFSLVKGFPVEPPFVNEVVVPGIASATTIAFLPDGRMLVGELSETIWVVQPGASEPDPGPFLQLDNSQLEGEQGLMDLVLDPDFAQNNYIYVFYTRGSRNRDRVSRFTVSGNAALLSSEFVVWEDPATTTLDHHGGALAFGPDGKLYISVGDNLASDDIQRLASYRGKVLRVNTDGSAPVDNPFFDGVGPNRDEIWALGFRNPFRMSFDPTGRLYLADVGGNEPSTAIEEINLVVAGANYGWPFCEGNCSEPGMTGPVYSYPHLGRDASITGGFFYRGNQFPAEYQGSYFFADYVQNWIKRLTFDANGAVTAVHSFEPEDDTKDGPYGDPVKLIEGPDGALYYVDIGFNDRHDPNEAAIRRIRHVPTNRPPVAIISASPATGLPPLDVNFSSAGSLDPEGLPLTYEWNFDDGFSSTEANPSHSYLATGLYNVRLTVSDGVNSALSANLIITVGNPPAITISSPANGSTFRAGDVITYAATANDVEDGPLSLSQFSWSVVFRHASHIHPAGGPFTNTAGGTLQIPESGHDFSGTTSYEISLSVTDSDGLRSTESVIIFPDKINLSLDTEPSGLPLEVDGIRVTMPLVKDTLIGFRHTINAPQTPFPGSEYDFVSWSDGGPPSRTIIVPPTDLTLVATYEAVHDPDLVAAYGFEEGTGNTVYDLSRSRNTGTAIGPTWTTGRFGKGLAFDGSDLVTVNDSTSLDLTGAFTLEAWVYPTSSGLGWKDIIYKAADIYFLAGSTETRGGAPAVSGTFSGTPVYGPGPLPAGTWSHLAATYNGAFLRLYVNATEVSAEARSGSVQTSNRELTIGGDNVGGQFWSGRIDEVRIYKRALTVSEISDDMNRAVVTVIPPKLTLARLPDATYRISIRGVPGLTYRIERSENLHAPSWQTLGSATANELGRAEFVDAPSGSLTQRFYRCVFP